MNGIASTFLSFSNASSKTPIATGDWVGSPTFFKSSARPTASPAGASPSRSDTPGSQHQTDRHGFAVHDRTIFLDGVSEGMPQIQQAPLPLLEASRSTTARLYNAVLRMISVSSSCPYTHSPPQQVPAFRKWASIRAK